MLQGNNLLKWLGVKHEIPRGLWLASALGGAAGAVTTVTGNAPLTLANALPRRIRSLTQYGLCTQAATPTPSDPVPIVCNNGEIKWDSVNERIYADGTPETITLGAQTASAESLFAVGDYADEQDIISGAVTRKVGVLVLDGTETWAAPQAGAFLTAVPNALRNASVMCTHWPTTGTDRIRMNGTYLMIPNPRTFTNENAFKEFLAAQYAAGTPAIVLYPLAESTTESVTPQPINTAEGTNTITVTANVSPITLDCEYIASA